MKDENSHGIAKWGWNCLSLTTLNIESNAFCSLPEFIWELPELQFLNASHNIISHLPCDTNCDARHNLKVDLSYNQLKEAPLILGRCLEIDLAFNELVTLPISLWSPKTIMKFDASHNSIREFNFPIELSNSDSSFYANMSKNISSDARYLNTEQLDSICSLTRLNIASNHLNGFPTDLACFVTHLQHLDISFNQIGNLDIQFLPPYLKGLNARECDISKFGLDEQKGNMAQKYCTLSRGRTNCVHKKHRSLPHLLYLNLGGNKLRDMQLVCPISKELLYPELKSLDLSSNDLHGHFSTDIQLQSNLFRLNLKDNSKLESIPAQLSLLSESLFELQLADLPHLQNLPSEYRSMPTQCILSHLRLQLQA